jgi:hypothetical protein
MQDNKSQSKWQQARRNWYWLVFCVVVLGAISYSIWRSNSQDYWDGVVGNGLATLLGIIAGVPIALAIERRRALQEEQERAVEQRDRASKVSFLIRDELAYNAVRLAERMNNRTALPLVSFKNDLWRALSDSGEIRWIDDPHVLSETASAYHYIGVVAAIEDRCYQAVRGINPRYDDGTRVSQKLLEDARRFDTQLGECISAAMAAIVEAVESDSAG